MIALIDMDGTLCDYNGTMLKELSRVLKKEITSWGKDEYEELSMLIKNQPGFWRKLPRIELGFKVTKILEELGFELNILSKGPARTTSAWSEKVEWCREHLPHVPVTITENKSLTYGKILFDDWPRYCEGWLEHRKNGLVIMPAYSYNEEFAKKYPDQVFRVTEDNLNELKEVLKKKFGK